MKFIIEHLEPEVSEWVLLEYKHISSIVGKENLIFTNVKEDADKMTLSELGDVKSESVLQLNLDKVCLLEMDGDKVLEPFDKNNFEYVVFGGILGDYPAQGRTKKHFRGFDCIKRNLGQEQMSTDTAVLVSRKIIDGIPFEEMKFKDEIIIPIREGEEVIMPFRYLLGEDGKPVLTPGLARMLREQEGF